MYILRNCTAFLIVFLLFISKSGIVFANFGLQENWVERQNLPYTLASQQSFIYQDHLYVAGGAGIGDVPSSNIIAAKINTDGSLGDWQTVGTLPQPLVWHSIVIESDKVFLLGGASNNLNSINSVYVSTVSSTGFSDWIQLPPLPDNLSLGGAVYTDDWIYYIGGFTHLQGSLQNKPNAYRARINPDSTLMQWEQLSPLPEGRSSFASFVNNQDVYIVGGRTNSSVATKEVYKLNLLTGQWTSLGKFPEETHRPGYFSINSELYVLGGYDGVQFSDRIYKGAVSQDGNVSWQLQTSKLPQSNCCFAAIAVPNITYIIGGLIGNSYTNKVHSNGSYQLLASPTPTPTPILKTLNVPDVKQYSSPWGSQTYDHAGKWSPSNPTIQRWGCSLTSAVMLLKYYGFDTNPDSLNNWLKAQNDGYTRNGGIMWPAVSRWSKINKGTTLPSLEFTYHNASESLIKTEIEANRPPILKMQKQNSSTHFLVATGLTDVDFKVNDPAFESNVVNLLSQAKDKWGENKKIGKFTPTNSDLSYIVLMLNNDVDMKVFDSNEIQITEDEFGTENPIAASDDESLTSGEILKSLYYAKPKSGTYKIEIHGSGTYRLDVYSYDKNGSVKVGNVLGALEPNGLDLLSVDFNNESIEDTSLPQTDYSFDAIIDDLESLYRSGLITSGDLYNSTRKQVEIAAKHFKSNKFMVSEIHLWNAQTKLLLAQSFQIDPEASELLITKLKLLIDSL